MLSLQAGLRSWVFFRPLRSPGFIIIVRRFLIGGVQSIIFARSQFQQVFEHVYPVCGPDGKKEIFVEIWYYKSWKLVAIIKQRWSKLEVGLLQMLLWHVFDDFWFFTQCLPPGTCLSTNDLLDSSISNREVENIF